MRGNVLRSYRASPREVFWNQHIDYPVCYTLNNRVAFREGADLPRARCSGTDLLLSGFTPFECIFDGFVNKTYQDVLVNALTC